MKKEERGKNSKKEGKQITAIKKELKREKQKRKKLAREVSTGMKAIIKMANKAIKMADKALKRAEKLDKKIDHSIKMSERALKMADKALRRAEKLDKRLEHAIKMDEKRLEMARELEKRIEHGLKISERALKKADNVGSQLGNFMQAFGKYIEFFVFPAVVAFFSRKFNNFRAIPPGFTLSDNEGKRHEFDGVISGTRKIDGKPVVVLLFIRSKLTSESITEATSTYVNRFKEVYFKDEEEREKTLLFIAIGTVDIPEKTMKFAMRYGLYVFVPSEFIFVCLNPEVKPNNFNVNAQK